MNSQLFNSPSFLSRAKKIEVDEGEIPNVGQPEFLKKEKEIRSSSEPDFLKRAKPISQEKFISDEEVQKEIERNQAQFTSRMLEGVLGAPGDVINFVGGLFGFEPGLPGSQEMRNFSEEFTQGYTKPKNELEEKLGETMQDIGLFAIPGTGFGGAARNIGIPVVSNLMKEGAKYLGGDEKKQAYSKVGTMIMLDLLSGRRALGSAQKYASSLFKKADELIPKGLSTNASTLESSLGKLEKTLQAGGSRPSTLDALTKVEEIQNKIKNGRIDLKELAAFRPSINEIIDKYKGFEFGNINPKIKEKIIHNLNDVKGEVIKYLEEYGEKFNPEYLKTSRAANEAYAAVAGSNKITNFIEKRASSKIKSGLLKSALGIGLTGGIGTLGSIAGLGVGSTGAVIGAGGYKALKTILRARSPTLRKHYLKIIESAAKGDAAAMSKNLKPLDKAFQEMEETGEFNP